MKSKDRAADLYEAIGGAQEKYIAEMLDDATAARIRKANLRKRRGAAAVTSAAVIALVFAMSNISRQSEIKTDSVDKSTSSGQTAAADSSDEFLESSEAEEDITLPQTEAENFDDCTDVEEESTTSVLTFTGADGEYIGTGEVLSDGVGECIASGTVGNAACEVYKIDGISSAAAVAVKLDGSDIYLAFVNSVYASQTIDELRENSQSDENMSVEK